ncbi:MAG: ssl1498 family light-harvesting-like protein [Leptolyngbyaceae cyanobacterium bins.59]|nr:ssl1498 family light-harvesting-like protein [Leptolyngbyaceae cyanobacterium bins.59]
MRYTVEDGGRLNNFAVEPKVYRAEPPTKAQQRNFLILGVGGLALVGGLIFVAFAVSNVG